MLGKLIVRLVFLFCMCFSRCYHFVFNLRWWGRHCQWQLQTHPRRCASRQHTWHASNLLHRKQSKSFFHMDYTDQYTVLMSLATYVLLGSYVVTWYAGLGVTLCTQRTWCAIKFTWLPTLWVIFMSLYTYSSRCGFLPSWYVVLSHYTLN